MGCSWYGVGVYMGLREQGHGWVGRYGVYTPTPRASYVHSVPLHSTRSLPAQSQPHRSYTLAPYTRSLVAPHQLKTNLNIGYTIDPELRLVWC